MADRTVVYLPLRSNAGSLIAGAGVASVRRRILLALLLHDRVALEGGLREVSAGPDGSFTLWMPPGQAASQDWQRPRARGSALGRTFQVAFRLSDAAVSSPAHVMVQSPTTIRWEATFEPFRREIPSAVAQWIDYGHADEPQELAHAVTAWDRAATSDPLLIRRWPEGFVRDVFVEGVHRDLAVSIALGAAISIDNAHAPVVASRIRSGEAAPILGTRSLELQVPVGFTWSDVIDLRRMKTLAEYRAVIRDIEAIALAAASSGADLDRRILDSLADRIARAEAKRPSWKAKVAVDALGLVAGVAVSVPTGGVPVVDGIAGAVISHGGGVVLDRRSRPSWLAVHNRLKRLS